MSSLARNQTRPALRESSPAIPDSRAVAASFHVTHNQSTQEGQHESIGTIYLSHNVFDLQFPFIGF